MFGIQLAADTTEVVQAAGGKVVGSVKVPTGTTDFSSFLLQAQSSGANVVATVFADRTSMYRADGTPHLRPVGETEFVVGQAAQSASGA